MSKYKDPKDELAELSQDMGLYKDPVHVSWEELTVMHNGKEALVLNKALLDQQNCWDKLEHIKWLHEVRLRLEDRIIEEGPNTENQLLEQWTLLQFELQVSWGFPKDARYHRFWDMKGCTCPKIDNIDAYPTGHYIYAGDCPIHEKEREMYIQVPEEAVVIRTKTDDGRVKIEVTWFEEDHDIGTSIRTLELE